MIRIGLAQLNLSVGDIKGNTKKIIDSVEKARKRNIDIIVFPELSLVGYPPQDLLLKKHFIKKNIEALKQIEHATKGIVAIVGFVHAASDGKGIYNASALIQNGKIRDIYCKINLPNYGVFDEKRYFTPGRTISIYSFKGYKFSVNICEDIWRKDYVKLLTNKGFDFIINISASPFHLDKLSLRKDILTYAALQAHCPIFYCNLVGGQDDLVFDGTSMVISFQGKVISVAKRFKEDLFVSKFPLGNIHPKNMKEFLPQAVFDALCLGLRDYVRKNGFNKVILGISGGIDSSVVASLAMLALGKENVYALVMPSRYTSKATLSDAKKVCSNLGIRYYIIPIDDIFKYYLNSLQTLFKGYAQDKTEENIQARIRGNILMAFSNKLGYLVLNTGNKSELSCGYCTLYGDMVGGFGVLSDIPKTLVYKVARYINKRMGKKVIPDSVLKRLPSAELRPHQRDTDTLPAYELLDPILKLYIEDDVSLEEMVKRGINKKLAKKIIKMVDKNEYKRRQAPPGIKITPRAFGKDRRMPITNKFSQ